MRYEFNTQVQHFLGWNTAFLRCKARIIVGRPRPYLGKIGKWVCGPPAAHPFLGLGHTKA